MFIEKVLPFSVPGSYSWSHSPTGRMFCGDFTRVFFRASCLMMALPRNGQSAVPVVSTIPWGSSFILVDMRCDSGSFLQFGVLMGGGLLNVTVHSGMQPFAGHPPALQTSIPVSPLIKDSLSVELSSMGQSVEGGQSTAVVPLGMPASTSIEQRDFSSAKSTAFA
jgi:hypothetical protein